MKRFRAVALFTLSGFLAAGNALAQQEVRANVPFSFSAGSKMLPAGDYSITPIRDDAIQIRNHGKGVAVLALATGTADQSRNGSVLVFEKHAGQYSLREILCAAKGMNVSLPAEHWKKGSYREEAMNSPVDDLVLIPVNK